MLRRIVYKGLFGIFDYDIELKNEGVTILTGPNGFGKSTILRSIDALRNFDIIFFGELDFKEIEFYSTEHTDPIVIKKQKNNMNINGIEIDIELLKNQLFKQIDRRFLHRIDEDSWIDVRTDEIMDKEKILRTYLLNNRYDWELDNVRKEDFEELQSMISEYSGETKFVKEQRIIKEIRDKRIRSEVRTINVIDELPNQLKEKMNQVSSRYSTEANNLDRTYPVRLFQTQEGINEEEYQELLVKMNEKFEKLNRFNISDIQSIVGEVEFQKEHSKALKVYFDDFELKYNVFEEFVNQLDIFTEIINSRLKFKEIRISREEGISVYKSSTGEKLSLGQLSSGEKQEIILFYELVFESEKNVHLLIDEPEISLHIEWQLKFMDDLLRIAKHKNFKVTVATHSPQIINNHWDIQVDLGEMYGN